MVKVKICGITTWRDAKLAIDAGADLLGFNFYPPSPRFIRPAAARDIIRRVPSRVQAVGVFVNESASDVADLAALLGLDSVQLHGEEPPVFATALSRLLPVVKAFRVRPGFRISALARYRAAARRGGFLLDGFSRRARGGSGKTFDWTLARRARHYGRIFLAGGLTPENVARAIRAARPFAVDVCSGVEASSGKKDPRRVRELMDAVRAAEREGK
jgi:phosphoribosylanthranilate isomerase